MGNLPNTQVHTRKVNIPDGDIEILQHILNKPRNITSTKFRVHMDNRNLDSLRAEKGIIEVRETASHERRETGESFITKKFQEYGI